MTSVREKSRQRAERFGDRMASSSREYLGWSARSAVRSLALTSLAALEAAGLHGGIDGALARPRVQILLLHHLFADELPRFKALLKRLAHGHEFITYSEAVERIERGRIERPAIAFSFDDGLESCAVAARILAEHGASACFFVVPSIVGERRPERLRRFGVDRLAAPATGVLGWDDLETMLAQGHEVGNHTDGHLDLGSIGEDEVVEQIGRGRDALVRRLGDAPHFAWPYGLFENFSAFAAKSAFTMGHRSVASAVRGCHVAHGVDVARPCLRRDNLVAAWPIGHAMHFLARASRSAAELADAANRTASGASAAPEHPTERWPDGWRKVIVDGHE